MSVEYHAGPSPRLLPRTVEEVLRHWAQRGTGVALGVAVLAAWAALITWSQNDPSLSVNTAQPARNLLGAPGAFVADLLLHTIGLAVVFFLIAPLALAVELTSTGMISELRKKLAFAGLATVCIAGGASALPLVESWPLETLGFGGILGDFLHGSASRALAPLLGDAAGAIGGGVFFAFGFWALSKSLCLERLDLLDVGLSSAFDANAFKLRPFKRRRAPVEQPEPAAFHDEPREVRRGHAEPRFDVGRFEPEPPSWSMGDRILDIQKQYESSANAAATPLPAADHAASGDGQPHHPVMLDGEGLEDPDDLPNLLRRERAKAPANPLDGVRLMPQTDDAPVWQPASSATHSAPERRPPAPAPVPAAKAPAVRAGYRRPSLNNLTQPNGSRPSADTSPAVLQGKARMLEDVLADFRIKGTIRDVRPGPVITLFEL